MSPSLLHDQLVRVRVLHWQTAAVSSWARQSWHVQKAGTFQSPSPSQGIVFIFHFLLYPNPHATSLDTSSSSTSCVQEMTKSSKSTKETDNTNSSRPTSSFTLNYYLLIIIEDKYRILPSFRKTKVYLRRRISLELKRKAQGRWL